MNQVSEQSITCPYCGEHISVLIDCSEAEQSYIEDCQVCCRPIELNVFVDDGGNVDISVRHENE